MRFGPPDDVLAGSLVWAPSVSSWLAGQQIADTIPVVRGTVSGDRGDKVPERLTLTVARTSTVNGELFDWLPGDDPLHPLAKYGQQLQVTLVVTAARTRISYPTQVAVYAIQSWAEQSDGSIQVEASGVLQLASDDQLISPLTGGGTFASQFNRLLPATLSGAIDGALSNRPCPATFNWSQDRLSALYELADAWPARVRADPSGIIRLLPPLSSTPTPLVSFTDGENGTMISAPRSDTRVGSANRVTAETDFGITATVSQLTGPMRVDGPYGVLPYRFSSGALSTVEEVTAAATAKLNDMMRGARTVTVTAVPDPRIDIDDPVEVIRPRADGTRAREWGWVDSYELPLTVNDGPMTLEISLA